MVEFFLILGGFGVVLMVTWLVPDLRRFQMDRMADGVSGWGSALWGGPSYVWKRAARANVPLPGVGVAFVVFVCAPALWFIVPPHPALVVGSILVVAFLLVPLLVLFGRPMPWVAPKDRPDASVLATLARYRRVVESGPPRSGFLVLDRGGLSVMRDEQELVAATTPEQRWVLAHDDDLGVFDARGRRVEVTVDGPFVDADPQAAPDPLALRILEVEGFDRTKDLLDLMWQIEKLTLRTSGARAWLKWRS